MSGKIQKICTILFILTLSLYGCGGDEYYTEIPAPGLPGNYRFEVICIDNVEYLKGYRSLSPHLKTDGKPYLCEMGE